MVNLQGERLFYSGSATLDNGRFGITYIQRESSFANCCPEDLSSFSLPGQTDSAVDILP